MNTTEQTTAIARQFGCTPAQVRAQFAKNAAQLGVMAEKAARTGRKINGYTAQQLRALATKAGQCAS